MPRPVTFSLSLLLMLALTATASLAVADSDQRIRFATLNAAMGLAKHGQLSERLRAGNDPDLRKLAEVVQRTRPDVLLLSEIDYLPGDRQAEWLAQYLARSESGLEPVEYAYHFSAPVNTGVQSGLDIDGNGQTGDPADAWGYGRFPGQYGMLLLSRYPIDRQGMRSFQYFLWRDMPAALRPVLPGGADFYTDETWNQLRLSSKSHWDIPIAIHGQTIHLLASHPTPPAFDGPEDRNGARNHDEIRLWKDYISPGSADYLVDDTGAEGGLPAGAAFVIAGDLNAGLYDGGARNDAIGQLLRHSKVQATCEPRSNGALEASQIQGQANLQHREDPALDTADFSDARVGNLRADYVLPSANLAVSGCGVFWPREGEPGAGAVAFSDHRLVWLDIILPISARP